MQAFQHQLLLQGQGWLALVGAESTRSSFRRVQPTQPRANGSTKSSQTIANKRLDQELLKLKQQVPHICTVWTRWSVNSELIYVQYEKPMFRAILPIIVFKGITIQNMHAFIYCTNSTYTDNISICIKMCTTQNHMDRNPRRTLAVGMNNNLFYLSMLYKRLKINLLQTSPQQNNTALTVMHPITCFTVYSSHKLE